MAQTLDQVLAELSRVYDPQAQAIQGQVAQLPGYYQAQRAGIETTKENSFRDIMRDAARRGVAYGGAPIDEQQKYLGSTYLPGLQRLTEDEGNQRFKLTSALNDLNSRRYEQAYGIRQKQLDTEAAERVEQQRLAAARAASAAAQGGTYFGNNQNNGKAQPSGQPAAAPNYNSNPDYWRNLINQFRYADGINRGWGGTAQLIEQRFGKIPANSVADQMFKQIFGGQSTGQTAAGALGALAGWRY